MTYEQLLEENEMLRWRLAELLGTELTCPLPALNGAKFRIMTLLAKRFPMTVSHEALNQAVNEDCHNFTQPNNTLKVHVSRARRALESYGIEIETVWGLGYRLSAESKTKWDVLVNEANGLEAAA